MSTITSNNPNPLPGGFPNTGSNIGAAPSATPPLELGTVIKAGGNNKALLDQLVQTLGTQQGNASDGLKNANGAPAIASPLDNISSDDLIDLLQAMRSLLPCEWRPGRASHGSKTTSGKSASAVNLI